MLNSEEFLSSQQPYVAFINRLCCMEHYFPNFHSHPLILRICFSLIIFCAIATQFHHKLVHQITLVNVSSHTALPPPTIPCRTQLWHLSSTNWINFEKETLNFPWEGYCLSLSNASVSAEHTADVFVTGMESYIPFYSLTISSLNLWFNYSCSETIQARDLVYQT